MPGIKVGKMYEKERILRFLNEKKKRNAKVVSISELTEFIEGKVGFAVIKLLGNGRSGGVQGCVNNATYGTN